jgi:hypothetical protein
MALSTRAMSQPMQLSTVEESQRRAAKAAGLAYLISFAAIAYVNFGIHSRLFSGDLPNYGLVDAKETSRNILADLPVFRLSIALLLSYCVGVAVVLAAFYLILRPFGQTIALIAAVCRVLLAGAWAIGTAQFFDTMRLLNGGSDLGVFSEGPIAGPGVAHSQCLLGSLLRRNVLLGLVDDTLQLLVAQVTTHSEVVRRVRNRLRRAGYAVRSRLYRILEYPGIRERLGVVRHPVGDLRDRAECPAVG